MENPDLQDFMTFLRNLRIGAGVTGLALVVRRRDSALAITEICGALGTEKALMHLVYDRATEESIVIPALREALLGGRWVCFEIRKDLSSELIQILNCMKAHHALEGGGHAALPESARLIALVEEEFSESGITYPYFLKLFGPVLRI